MFFWDLQRRNRVACAILHTEVTTMAWAFGLRNLEIPGPVFAMSGMPYDHARNAAAMRALEIGSEYLFFLDSDVIPPRDAVMRLLAHDLPIVSGVYWRRSPPLGKPVLMRNFQWVEPEQAVNKGLIEVDLVGTGCLLIRRDVLEQLPPQRPGKHWFDWRVDMKGVEGMPPMACLSEDYTFCAHAREKLGIKIIADTSIQCRHVGYAEAGPGTFVACNHDPNAGGFS